MLTGVLVQLVRIHACHAWGHGFESRTHRSVSSAQRYILHNWCVSSAGKNTCLSRMGSRVRVPYTPQTLPKVQCFRKRFALYVIYILAKFKSCFDRLQSGKTQTCKRTQAQALPLMRATRPEVAEKYSDAGRVAPISVSVSSSTKRYHQTLPPNATTKR